MLLRVKWDTEDTLFSSGSADGVLNVWNARRQTLHCRLSGHRGSLNDLDFSPLERSVVATVSSDKSVLLGELPIDAAQLI